MSDSATTTPTLPKDAAAEKGMVNVQVDGVWIQVPRGTRMIEAAKLAKKDIPHYCYHPKLSSPGNCRMCLVQMGMPPRLAPGQDPEYGDDGYQEIGWMPRPVIACANTVAENMGIRTTGTLVEKCREGVMEFLLINHPLDCPICDQAGECRLQEFSVEHGKGTSRFREDKIKKPKNVEIGPRIRLDDERCIMCSRCIRFMDEVADDPVLGFSQRGTHTSVTVHPGRKLDSNYSLNTADICPVGALTSNDFRFQMRVWFLKETQTIDTNCGTGINTTVWTRGNKIFRITPRQNDDVNSCWMPDSHRLNFHYVDDESRLTDPMVKNAGGAEVVSWTDALSSAATRLKDLAGSEIAIVASGSLTNEEYFLTQKLASQLATQNLVLVENRGESDGKLISEDSNANSTGAELVLGHTPYDSKKVESVRAHLVNGSIKAVIVLQEELLDALKLSAEETEKIEFIIAVQNKAGVTAGVADVLFPGAYNFEKRGSMVNVTGRLQRLNAAVLPPADAREDWEILRDLCKALDSTAPDYFMIEDVVKDMTLSVKEFEGFTLSKIGKLGVSVKDTGVTIPLLEKEKARLK